MVRHEVVRLLDFQTLMEFGSIKIKLGIMARLWPGLAPLSGARQEDSLPSGRRAAGRDDHGLRTDPGDNLARGGGWGERRSWPARPGGGDELSGV